MTRMEYCESLRAATDRHWNCCQSVLTPFAEELGLTTEQAYALGMNFGAGMKCGEVCGALTGALMVLGFLQEQDTEGPALMKKFRTDHTAVDCKDLLRIAAQQENFVKKQHCDGLVYEMVNYLENYIAEHKAE